MKKISKRDYFNLLLAFLSVGLITTSLGSIANELIIEQAMSIEALGNVISARSAGYLLGAFLSIYVYAKIDYFWLSPFLFIGMMLVLFAVSIQSTALTLTIAFFLLGIMKNLITVGGNQLGASFLNRDAKANVLNNIQFSYGIGTIVSPVLTGYTLREHSISGAILLFSVLSLANAIMYSFTPKRQEKETVKRVDNKDSNSFTIIVVCLFFAFYAGIEIFIGTWGPYIITMKQISASQANICISAFWLTLAFSKVIIIFFLKKKEATDRSVVCISIALTLLFLVLICVSSGFLPIFLLMSILGLSMGNIVPYTIKHLNNSQKVSSSETAWCFVGAGLGGIIFSQIYSALISSSIILAYGFAVVQTLFIALLFYFLEHKMNWRAIYGNKVQEMRADHEVSKRHIRQ